MTSSSLVLSSSVHLKEWYAIRKFMMRVVLIGFIILFRQAAPLFALEKKSLSSEHIVSGGRPFSSDEEALKVISSYLVRMHFPPARLLPNTAMPILALNVQMQNTAFQYCVVIDNRQKLVYVFLDRYLTISRSHPNLRQILQTLMEKNWHLNIGRYEWDPSDGEVRLSYTVSTENGIGFETFKAITKTLLITGNQNWPELSCLAKPQ
jgi:hypothetical protein